ncbi:MAG TPA: 3-hydroxyacyl-CoA dehydrogenase NAD-binding domain-containing protein [Jatrophihabitans sp.]|jgi:3-hydroxyacyl-CoA dehydrogenase/enoyl-CoA hydratase/3-hydroxybutyryl-CoA epimerase
MTTTIRWNIDADGIVTLTLDDPNATANTMTQQFVVDLTDTVNRLYVERESVIGVVLTSAKKTFFAGGDLHELVELQPEDAPRFTEHLNHVKSQLRALETLGRPVVSAINGAALGGGLELALATHHRLAADVAGNQIGLPEVGLGLLPAGGGIVRTSRLLGVTTAVERVLSSGTRYTPRAALKLGLVDEVLADSSTLITRAKEWIFANPDAAQPWDTPGYTIPGGTPTRGPLSAQVSHLSATLRSQTNGAPAPAERAILAAAVEGAAVDIDTAELIETRYFIGLATGQIAKNRINLTFFDAQRIKAGGSRPTGQSRFRSSRLGVVGAGMMGAGIAYAAARAGIEVVLVDVSLSAAQMGKQYAERAEAKAVETGRSSANSADLVLSRIRPTDDMANLTAVDFVIEAVFENAELKAKVFGQIETSVAETAVLGSNTSTLPITVLAAAVSRPADFVGVHFFSPADRMPLVELIRGKQTSQAALAKAYDLVLQLGKTPIVVNDSRGFFTSRVITARLNEAVGMLGEGVNPVSIEQASLQAGYPTGTLQLLDELTLTLPRTIREKAEAAATVDGRVWASHPSEAAFDRLIDGYGRVGRAAGSGLYDYVDGKRKALWSGLAECFPPAAVQPPFTDLIDRLLFAEALEAWRVYDAGVIESAADANVGSHLGIGFPAWTGGALRYIDQYPGGRGRFVERSRELAERYGAHFTPSPSMLATAG